MSETALSSIFSLHFGRCQTKMCVFTQNLQKHALGSQPELSGNQAGGACSMLRVKKQFHILFHGANSGNAEVLGQELCHIGT